MADDYLSLSFDDHEVTSMLTIPRSFPGSFPALALTAAVTVASAGLLTACASASAPQQASQQSSPAASGTASSQQTQGAQAGSSSSAPRVTPSRVPGPGSLAVCQSTALKVVLDTSQAGGAAGSVYYPVNFTNTSAAPCGLYGYPGMSFVTAARSDGQQIGAAAQRNPAFGKLSVRLPAGGVAHAWLQVAQAGNYPASACRPETAHWLRVYPPGDTVASYVDVSLSACASASAPLLTVTPVRSGRGVRGVTP
jgi:Protein of unknown function (DUF4232)